VLLLQHVIDAKAVVEQGLPAIMIGEVAKLLGMFAMPAMIMRDERKTAFGGSMRETFVAPVMFAKSMK
jgi:hypothetical protein